MAKPAFCEVVLEWGREFRGFGKRLDHCVEEDILEKRGWEIREYVCKILTCLVVCTRKFRIVLEGEI